MMKKYTIPFLSTVLPDQNRDFLSDQDQDSSHSNLGNRGSMQVEYSNTQQPDPLYNSVPLLATLFRKPQQRSSHNLHRIVIFYITA